MIIFYRPSNPRSVSLVMMARDYSWCRWELVGGFAKSVSRQLTAYCICFTACVFVASEMSISFLSRYLRGKVLQRRRNFTDPNVGFANLIFQFCLCFCHCFSLSVFSHFLVPCFSFTYFVTFCFIPFFVSEKKTLLAHLCIAFFLVRCFRILQLK